MKSSQPIHDSIADEQAALWAARLDGDTLDSAQRAELDAWLAQKPHHRALLSRYCQFSADLEEQIPALVSAEP
jgi:transmembrane sensor